MTPPLNGKISYLMMNFAVELTTSQSKTYLISPA
ncbi:hypothetical protein VAA_03958 [Vibrio anguillarum 775]|nr:hypothetical protein VAA_03958 [Vibrio anguillarum 775]